MIYALTSLSPSPTAEPVQSRCLESWRAAGLSPVALNHPTEVASLQQRYPGVEFVPVSDTTESVFERPYVPIKRMLSLAESRNAWVLILNSDIHLELKQTELDRLVQMTDGGLCYFVRHNYSGDTRVATVEKDGIDAFLIHGRDARLFPNSFLSMGQPWWDYWLPCAFIAANRKVFSVEYPVSFHLRHPIRWSQKHWEQCQWEFARLTGIGSRMPHAPSVRKHIGERSVPVW